MFDVNEPTGLLVGGIIEEVDLSAKFWLGIQSQFDVWQKNQIFFSKHLGGRGGASDKVGFLAFCHIYNGVSNLRP